MSEEMKKTKTEEIAGKFLGKKVEGKSQYDKSFLVAVPRQENRTYLGLTEENYPRGFDTWYGYEFTVLLNGGAPVNRVIKISYSSGSDSIVESKSLKLYLNSFAMTRMGDTEEETIEKAKQIITEDLSTLLNTRVSVGFINEESDKVSIFNGYSNMCEYIKIEDITIDKYNEDYTLLKTNELPAKGKFSIMFPNMRSRCRVTSQPDYGKVFIYYKSEKMIDIESLYKYLCSFRNENHFHEECCEAIFTRLSSILNPEDELMVAALYTRRGGIDINPVRIQNIFHEGNEDIIMDLSNLSDTNTFTRADGNLMQ